MEDEEGATRILENVVVDEIAKSAKTQNGLPNGSR